LEPALRTLRPDQARYDGTPLDAALAAFAAGEFEADGIPSGAVAVVGGALDGIERILREHVRPGDGVAVEDPCVPAVTDLVEASGLRPIPVAVDANGPHPDGVEEVLARGARAIVITPRAQNPTGAAIDDARAADLRRVLGRYPRVVVVENDYIAPIAGVPSFPLRAGSDAPWAIVRSTSKFLGPDLRVALLAGDQLTVTRVRRRQALGARWVSLLLQRLTLALWADPAGGRRLARASEIYAQRRQALQAALASHGVAVTARSGFNLWVPVRDEAAVVASLADRGWAVAPGERFRLRSAPGIRVTTSALEPADAARFAADLALVLRLPRLTPA
jgi:DNA-binding transcriptional MocR family regulator